MTETRIAALRDIFAGLGDVAVAVSGGVDSLTLATVAHRTIGAAATMFHATSPAVPPEASERVRTMGAREGWQVEVFDAGEFADRRYLENPGNRCFFCKVNLYGAIRGRTAAQIVSGANLDDLGEYRPGLDAAREHGVRHPYVEAGIDKNAVRAIARELGLGAVAELPAAPCLASRVESGIPVLPATLAVIHAAEKLVTSMIRPVTVRCRVRATGVVIELDAGSLGRSEAALRASLARLLDDAGIAAPISFAAYRAGSAFLRPSP